MPSPDATHDYPSTGEPDDRAQQHDAPLTLEETCQLRALGPTRYRQQVISLFASGQATEAQWAALARACHAYGRLWPSPYPVPTFVQRFQDRSAAQHEWQAMATLVLLASESAQGDALTLPIDRAILARHAAHEAGRDAWGRWSVG